MLHPAPRLIHRVAVYHAVQCSAVSFVSCYFFNLFWIRFVLLEVCVVSELFPGLSQRLGTKIESN